MQTKWRRRLLTILSIVAMINIVMFYGLPNSFRIPIIAILVFIYLRTDPITALATTISLGAASILCVLTIYLLGLDKTLYYRPLEILTQEDYEHGYRISKKNTRIEMTQPHGDLGAISTINLSSPRKIIFKTDSAGFRNDNDYTKGQIVLIGDSFVMGEGTTQADILGNQLISRHGIPTYNIAYPGNIADYLKVWKSFREQHPGQMTGLLFLYEGNDFDTEYQPEQAGKPNFYIRWAHKYRDIFTRTVLYRVTKSLYARAKRSGVGTNKAVVTNIDRQGFSYSQSYARVSNRAEYSMPEAMLKDLIELGNTVDHIYFIPTKYRVYAKQLGVTNIPNAQWDALSKICETQNWECTNLTPYLISESEKLLKESKFTWWPDDTHWNKAGISVATRVVSEDLHRKTSSNHN